MPLLRYRQQIPSLHLKKLLYILIFVPFKLKTEPELRYRQQVPTIHAKNIWKKLVFSG